MKSIGASKCAAVLGIDPWISRVDLYDSIVNGVPLPGGNDRAKKRGLYLENAILDWRQDDTGKPIVRRQERRQHPLFARLHATPDGVVENGKGLECTVDAKSPSHRQHWDELPDHYVIQGVVQAAVFDAPRAEFVALINGDIITFHVKNDEDLAGYIIGQVQKFWVDHIDKRVPPDIDDWAKAEGYLRRKFPKSMAPMLDSTSEIDHWASVLEEAQRMRKAAEESEAIAKNHIREWLGPNEGVVGDWGKILYRSSKGRAKIDTDRLYADFGIDEEVLKQYTKKVNGSRVFRPYWSATK